MEDLTEHWKPYRSIGGSRASHHIMRLQTYDTWEKGATICGLLQGPLRNKYVSCLSMNRYVFLSIHFGAERDWIKKASDRMRSSTKCGKGIFGLWLLQSAYIIRPRLVFPLILPSLSRCFQAFLEPSSVVPCQIYQNILSQHELSTRCLPPAIAFYQLSSPVLQLRGQMLFAQLSNHQNLLFQNLLFLLWKTICQPWSRFRICVCLLSWKKCLNCSCLRL